MTTARFGAIATKKGSNWAFVDGSGSYISRTILRIPSGGYYVFTSYTGVLYKISDTGAVVWQKTVGLGDQAYMSKLFQNGDILFYGILNEFNDRGLYGRFNPESGSFSWYKYFMMGAEVYSTDITMDSTESYGYISFSRKISGSDPNTDPIYPTISRINLANGTVQWTQEVVPPGGLRGYAERVVADSSGNAYLFGWYLGVSDFSVVKGFLVKYNSSGTVQWQKVFTRTNIGSYTEIFYSEHLTIDSSNNLHLGARYRYAGDPTYGDALYYAKFDSSGNLLNQYGILPSPVPNIDFPTYIQVVTDMQVDSSNNAYMHIYGRFDNSVSTQYTGTVTKITNGNTLSYLSTTYMGNSVTEGFSGPSGFSVDSTNNKLLFGVYRFTGGPEVVLFNVPSDGSATNISVAPKALRANYRDIMPAALATPPVTVASGSLTLRSATESYTFQDATAPTVSSATYEKYIQRF